MFPDPALGVTDAEGSRRESREPSGGAKEAQKYRPLRKRPR